MCKENNLGLVTGKALLIDEADSLLTSREGATKSWEVGQVNELLMQIERFQNPLFIATNHFKALDKALLRSLDFKIELQALKHKQAISLFEEVVGVGLDMNSKNQLNQMTNLTAGDFAVLARRLRFRGKNTNSEEAFRIFKVESDLRMPNRRIGF